MIFITMRKFFDVRVLLILLILFGNQLSAQVSESATYLAKFLTAQKYMKGDGLPQNKEKAISLYVDCAENGKLPFAMNELGSLYKKGRIVSKDAKKAFYWFSKSAQLGDPIGMFYLGTMYKNGDGTNQNFSKAYDYFKASAEKGFYGGCYATGYCKFKGLGTSQNYSEAVQWFQKGNESNDPASKMMLGICLRNGYGIEKDEKGAKDLLQEASKSNLKITNKELNTISPENSDKDNQEKSNNPSVFKRLGKNQNDILYSGKWNGTRYFFDWSGVHVIGKDSIRIEINQNGKLIKGQWLENGVFLVEFNGQIEDGQIVFNNTKFTGKNRYGESEPIQFVVGRFQQVNSNENMLEGNIESYSLSSKEPGYPCYLVLSRVQEKSAKIDTTKEEKKLVEKQSVQPIIATSNTDNQVEMKSKTIPATNQKKSLAMTAYPNPFANEINIEYNVEIDNNVSLSIYSLDGKLILEKKLGNRKAGNYNEHLNFSYHDGTYLLKLTVGKESISQKIIKKTY